MSYDFQSLPAREGTDSIKWACGPGVIPAWIADMDFRTAPEITRAIRERAEHDVFGYPEQAPASALEAAVEYLETRRGWKVDPSWIVFTPGLVPALNAVARLCPEDGGIVTTVPIYPPFLSAPENFGRSLTRVPMAWDAAKGRWFMDTDALEAATPADAKVFLLCNPHNPLGRVFEREELAAIAAYAEKRDLTICSDEIHCDLVLDPDKRHVSIATLSPEIAARTISLFSSGKTWNLAGLFCGFAVIPDAARRASFRRAADGMMNKVGLFGYVATEAAFRHGEPWRLELLVVLRTNLALVEAMCRETPGVKLAQRPEATYLAWLDVRELGFADPVAAFSAGGVRLSGGADFAGPGHIRLNFGCPTEHLKEILRRFRATALGARR